MSAEREEVLEQRVRELERQVAEQGHRLRYMEEYLAAWSRQGQAQPQSHGAPGGVGGSPAVPSAGRGNADVRGVASTAAGQGDLGLTGPAPPAGEGMAEKKDGLLERVSGFWKQDYAEGTLLNRVGIVALLLALVFFLKYAFDNNWIGDLGRVAIGVVFGLSLLGGGEYFRGKGYPRFAYGFTGGGLGSLYASFYAAYEIYGLMDVYGAFGLMILTTGVGIALALRHNSPAIAALGVLGGFLTPFILQTPKPSAVGLFSYIALLNLVILGIALRRRWRAVHLLGFFLTVLSTAAWVSRGYKTGDWAVTLGFGALYFVLYLAVTVFYSLQSDKGGRKTDMVLLLANPTLYFLLLWDIMDWLGQWDAWGGFFAVLMAAVYLLVGVQVFQRAKEDPLMAQIILAVSAAFLTLAVPIQFEEETVTLLWSAEAVAIWYGALRLRDDRVKIGAGLLGLVALFHLFFFDTPVHVRGLESYLPLLNERTLAYAGVITAFSLAYWLYRREAGVPEGKGGRWIKALPVAAVALTILIFTLEADTYGEFRVHQVQKQLDQLFEQYNRPLERYDGSNIKKYDRITPVPDEYQRPLVEQMDRWNDFRSLSVSGVWTVSAVTLIILGLRRSNRAVRISGLALLGLVLGKIFFIDLARMNILFRIITFAGVGSLTLLASYLYQRRQKEGEG